MIRWALKLSEFNIEWEHRPGVQNVVADLLSRNPVDSVEGSQISCAALRALAINSREQFIKEQREDPELGHIYRYLENPDDGSVNATGLGSNPRKGMDVCKCIVPSHERGTLNSRRANSPLVRLVEREERWEASDHPQGVLPQNWDGTE
ncbi:uncharacterized protein TNCV_4930121 [Trichonephila clavipes]|nr:uncharacterized protein TNCV_4930121 [Trichonephila clavipes]